ncbi:MAG: hypothetical protein AAFP77_30585 [Bacteroidota bacterium]
MEKLRIFALLFAFGLGLNFANAQCNFNKDLSSPEIFAQDPSAKAAVIAATDDTIEERVNPKTGQKYYVRRFVSPWSGEPGYSFITFDTELEDFVEHHTISYLETQGDQGDDGEKGQSTGKGAQTPGCQQQKDSTQMQQRKLLPEDAAPANRQPRRSSRVKLAALF